MTRSLLSADKEPIRNCIGRRIVFGALSALLGTFLLQYCNHCLPYGRLLVDILEQRFKMASDAQIAQAKGVIALGGGAGERIQEAGHLARRFPHLTVVVTGSGFSRSRIVELLGANIDQDRLLIEEYAQNTRQNADLTSRLVNAKPGNRWVITTSVWHMPRAIGTFRKHGFDVLPWLVHDTPTGLSRLNDIARHEWLGLLAYRALGESAELFPAPEHANGKARSRVVVGVIEEEF